MELTTREKQRIEDRAFWHYKTDISATFQAKCSFRKYWKVNKKACLKNGIFFKRLFTEYPTLWEAYLTEYDRNPWTMWSIATING